MSHKEPTRWYDRIAWLYDPFILGSYNRARRATIRQSRLEPGQTVLDVACGTGENFRFILAELGPSGFLIGTDFSSGMLAQASRKIEKNAWQNVRLLPADARVLSRQMLRETLAMPDLQVDRIICTLGLTVVPEWQTVFASTWDILKPNGRYAIMDWYIAQSSLFTRLVNSIAASDISRRWWEPLEQQAVAFERETMVRGIWHIVSGSKPVA